MPYKFLEDDVEQPQEQSTAGNILRQVNSGLARGVTSAALAVPDLLVGATNLGVAGLNKAAEFLPEKARRLAPGGKIQYPTLPYPSEVAYEQLSKVSPELRAESDAEKRWQEFAGDVGTLFAPVGGLKKIQSFITDPSAMVKSLKTAVGLAGVGNTAKFLSDTVGYSPETGEKIKLGTMLGVGLIGAPRISNYVEQQYEKAKTSVPQGTKYKDTVARKKLEQLEIDLAKRSFNGKEKVQEVLNTALANASGDRLDFNDIMQARKDAGSFYPTLERKGIGRQELKKITDIYRESMNNAYKGTKSKKLKDSLKIASDAAVEADKIYSAIKDYDEANSWFNLIFSSKNLISPAAKLLFGVPGAVIGAGFTGALHGKRLLDFVTKTPEVRQAYKNMYKAYASNNKDLAMKSLAIIDKKLAEEFPDLSQSEQGTYTFLN